ncbi:tetratricopeptide repeat-containing serine protease family protein [Okeania sp. SIO1I7]|uniref:tetratricopeptide repeat-containing S1 family peptidase n=1 Tax=Okeania sp. SIO1I7 TaxID=2607772 RepID=UPI0013F8B8EE|nr:tetratricopeptide repeat-containing serine protease family protein [Okeania sp. SIO1I7]NET27155.1 serine protease [Okeania sp. SIO1I7]
MNFKNYLWIFVNLLFPIQPLFLTSSLLLFPSTAIVLMQPAAKALMADEINQIATEFTVLIDSINPASGVIISRKKDTYYVLTAKHVVETQDEYAVITKDGERHKIDYQRIIKLPGVDLALLEFRSQKKYQIASLADYDYKAEFRHVFVSGWPASRLPFSQRERLFSPGLLINQDYELAFIKDPVSNGYELFYNNITELGLSGAPILDTQGRVIGIHGASEGTKIYDEKSNSVERVSIGFSYGIPINTFLQLADKFNMRLNIQLENSPPRPLTQKEAFSIEAYLKVPETTDISSAAAWSNRGNHLYRLERFEEALIAFERAIKIRENFHPAWYGKGNVLSALGRYDRAIDAYQKTVKIKPDFYLAWRDKGALLAYLDQPHDALISFNQVIRYKPDDFVVWYLRGNILTKHFQEYKQAIAAYNKAIQLKSDFVDAWVGKGEVLYRLERYQEAREVAQQALKLKPNDPEISSLLNALDERNLPPDSVEWRPNQNQVERRNYPPRKPPNLLW